MHLLKSHIRNSKTAKNDKNQSEMRETMPGFNTWRKKQVEQISERL